MRALLVRPWRERWREYASEALGLGLFMCSASVFAILLFGGEGLFFAVLTGPGKVILQSLPFSRLAGRIFAAAPQGGGKSQGEGSVLGGLGNLIDGDN